MTTFMRGVVGVCLLFSLAVGAAPTVVRQGFGASAEVRAVACSIAAVKKKACAPETVTTQMTQAQDVKATNASHTGNVKAVVTTVLYF